jgi:hypothetical protein
MRTPMSVNSMNVETGSIASGRDSMGDLDGDATPPQVHTPSASAQDDTHLSGDIAELSLDVHAGTPPHSPKGAFLSGIATPTSTAGSALDDRAREEATERQLEAYENEAHDRARSPEAHEEEPTATKDESGQGEDGRIRHVPLTAHEVAQETNASPIPDTDDAPPRPDPSPEEVEDSSLISEVPGNAMGAAQPASKPVGAFSPTPDVAPPSHSHLAMTNAEPEVAIAVPVEVQDRAPVPDAGDVEALRVEGGVKADADAIAAMAGPTPVIKADDGADDGGVTGDFLDSYDDDDEPKVKCSDCQAEVPLSELGEHQCDSRPPPQQAVPDDAGLDTSPSLPSSSTFGGATSLDGFVSQHQAASEVPEDVGLEEDLEVLSMPTVAQQARAPDVPVDSPAVSSAQPDIAPAQTRLSHELDRDSSESPLDSEFPKPPGSASTSPTAQRVMAASVRRASGDSSGSNIRHRRSPVPRSSLDDDSDGEYEGGWARPISSTR